MNHEILLLRKLCRDTFYIILIYRSVQPVNRWFHTGIQRYCRRIAPYPRWVIRCRRLVRSESLSGPGCTEFRLHRQRTDPCSSRETGLYAADQNRTSTPHPLEIKPSAKPIESVATFIGFSTLKKAAVAYGFARADRVNVGDVGADFQRLFRPIGSLPSSMAICPRIEGQDLTWVP